MNKEHISGIVIHGNALGRTIGFPTANVSLKEWIVKDGVYALKILVKDTWYDGIWTYRVEKELFEANIFDFDRDIYGELIEIEMTHKIRENERFPSLEALKEQIERDSQTARALLSQ